MSTTINTARVHPHEPGYPTVTVAAGPVLGSDRTCRIEMGDCYTCDDPEFHFALLTHAQVDLLITALQPFATKGTP